MKDQIEQYILLIVWYMVHWNDPTIKKAMFYNVANKIGSLEDSLRDYGISLDGILKLQAVAKKVKDTPLEQFSPEVQVKIYKIIFGEKTKWE